MPPKQVKTKNNPFVGFVEYVGEKLEKSVKQEDLMMVVKTLIDAIKEVEDRISKNRATDKADTEKILSNINESLRGIKDELEVKITANKSENKKEIEDKYNELSTTLGYVESLIKEYDDTELKGMIEEVKSSIPEMPEIPEAFDPADIVEDIEELEKKVEELEKRSVGRGGGITDKAVQFAIMRSIQAVTPTGTIDGVNTTFTVPSTIHAVFSFELNSRVVALGEYTITGSKRNTIVFDTAPSANYSGKSFVITYI